MKLLITGALGHIGSRIIHEMHPADYEKVVLIDNLATQRYCSLFNLPKNIPFRFIEADVCAADLNQYFDGIDVVIHLAAITDAAGSIEIQDQVERVNYEGTKKVAHACVNCGCKLIFLSTTSVYGTQQKLVDENCTADELKPQSPYAMSKLRAEELLQSLGKSDGLKFIICRFGTIYGTSIGMRFHTAINKFCWQAVMGQPITVWRTALNQKRPYLDLGDATRALRFIIQRNLFTNEIFNVLSQNATVGEIIAIIKEYIPDLSIQFVDSPIMNQLSYEVSNERFCAQGFDVTGSMKQCIASTIELLRSANVQIQ